MTGAAAFWTEADQAELDVLLWEILGMFDSHRRCGRCRSGPGPCQPVRDAFQAFEDWLAARRLLSRAEWVRREHVRGYLAELHDGRAA